MATTTRTLISSFEQFLPMELLSPTERRDWDEMLEEHEECIKQVEEAFQALIGHHKKKIHDLNNLREANKSLAIELNNIQEEFSDLQGQWGAPHKGKSSKSSTGADRTKEQSRGRLHQSMQDCTRNQLNSSQQPSTPFIPNHLLCPLTHEPFVDPVVDHEGNTYEKEAILEWLAMHPSSPLTRNHLRKDQLIPNRAVNQAVDFWTGFNKRVHDESLRVHD